MTKRKAGDIMDDISIKDHDDYETLVHKFPPEVVKSDHNTVDIINQSFTSDNDQTRDNLINYSNAEHVSSVADSNVTSVKIDNDHPESESHMDTTVPDDHLQTITNKENIFSLELPASSSNANRKPLSKWLIYVSENRDRVMQELGETSTKSFSEATKILSERYKKLSPEAMNRLTAMVEKDKRELHLLNKLNPSRTASKKPSELIIPSGRVKRVIKMDPAVKNIAREATSSIARATELFVAYLANKSWDAAKIKGSRMIRDADVAQSIHMNSSLEFLRLDFPRKVAPPGETLAQSSSRNSSKIGVGSMNKSATSYGSKSNLLNFFQNDAQTRSSPLDGNISSNMEIGSLHKDNHVIESSDMNIVMNA